MLSQFEKEKEIIRLLEEGKTYRYIQEVLNVSPSQISAAKKKYEGDDGQPSLRIQAYKMFQDKKELTDVAIILQIDDVEATRYFNEYLHLKQESILL